ncbi:MAG: hypothetical protein WEA09_09930 [Gemmatimonadota bacterium]
MTNIFSSFFTVAVVLTFALPVGAQQGPWAPAGSGAASVMMAQSAAVTGASAQPAPVAGPTLASLAFPVSMASTTFNAPLAEMRQPSRRNTALMVVGAAGLVLGAVVGGDEGTIIMIAGGGVGLWGLWRHLS